VFIVEFVISYMIFVVFGSVVLTLYAIVYISLSHIYCMLRDTPMSGFVSVLKCILLGSDVMCRDAQIIGR